MIENKNITEKLFRIRENLKKIEYITKNSDITIELIQKAAILSKKNPYHSFGHELGATEQGIRLAIAQGMSREEINLIGIALLFHDADHSGIVKLYDEMRSIELANAVLIESDTIIAGSNHTKVLENMRDLILETTFPVRRGRNDNPMVQIIQDADLAHLGQGPDYWGWSSMGLVDEFNRVRTLSPQQFIKDEQEKFVRYVSSLSGTGKFYLSKGAQKIFGDPLVDVLVIKNWSDRAIQYAYDVRMDDITLEEFSEKIKSFNA